MMQWDRLTLGRMAKELGFSRDTLEKVCRLADVLKFMETDELLAEGIALKGGTDINLTIFDLPRLSVDIDLDLMHKFLYLRIHHLYIHNLLVFSNFEVGELQL